MRKKGIKITIYTLSALFILIIAMALFISPIAKYYIEKNSKELIGRKILIKDLRLNIFTGTLKLKNIRMYEVNDKDVFASVDSFYVDVELLKLLSSKLEIAKITVIKPFASIIQNGDTFNFDDLIPDADTTETKEPSSFPKSIVINDIFIGGGKFIYSDLAIDNTIRLKDLGVTIPKLAFEQGQTDAGIKLKIGDNATLESKFAMDMKSNEYKLNIKLGQLPITIARPYIEEYFNLGILEGYLNTDLFIAGNMNHIMDFSISGTASATEFKLTNNLNEPVLAFQSFDVKADSLILSSSAYMFNYIYLDKLDFNYIQHKNTDNIAALFKSHSNDTSDTIASSESPSSPLFKTVDFHLKNSTITYVDNTLKKPLKIPLSAIDLQAKNFDLNNTNLYHFKANFPKSGSINASWKANLDHLENQELLINLKSLNIALFSPYCYEYTAQELNSGKMNFVSKNKIQNNNIRSINAIDVFNADATKRDKTAKAEYNVPLKLGLYLLKDKDKKIKFDIPVKGNINDPEFSYRKIIFQTIANLIVKVAVSPVRFIANSMGFNPDEMAAMEIEVLQSDITAEQFSQMDKLTEIYQQKPELTISMTQFLNSDKALSELALLNMKQLFLDSVRSEQETRNKLTYEESLHIKNSDDRFVAFVNRQLAAKNITMSSTSSVQQKSMTFFNKDSLQPVLSQLIEKRNQLIQSYLNTTGIIPEEKLNIKTITPDSLNLYNGKPLYKIELQFPGEE